MSSKINYLLICLALTSKAIFAQDFYVDPLGNDTNNGTASVNASQGSGPFKTLSKAQQAVQTFIASGAIASVTVHINSGTYQLQSPLIFSNLDSGLPSQAITWVADNGLDSVIITGGIPLTNCKSGSSTVWTCPAAALNLGKIPYPNTDRQLGNGVPGFNLFINGERLHLARWPNAGYAHAKQIQNATLEFSTFETLPNFQSEIAHAQIHGFLYAEWLDQFNPIQSVAQNTNTINLGIPSAGTMIAGARFYIQNLESQLDAPGEWFYESTTGNVKFILPTDIANPTNITVSSLNNLVTFNNANYITFKNLAFRNSTGNTIVVNKSANLLFDTDEISNVDGAAFTANSSSNIQFVNGNVFDIGSYGIQLDGGDVTTLKSSGNIVSNNHISYFGMLVETYKPAISLSGVGAIAEHNLLEQGNHTAITVSGNNHLITKNEIRFVCTDSSDCGALYSGRSWVWRGNVITNNYFHDIYGYSVHRADVVKNIVEDGIGGQTAGVYLDDGLAGFSVIGNIFYNAGSMSILSGGGRDTTIKNNIIFTNNWGIFIDDRGSDFPWQSLEDGLLASPYKNPAWTAAYPNLQNPIKNISWPENDVITNNIIITATTNYSNALLYFLPNESTTLGNNLYWNTSPNNAGITGSNDFIIAWNILDKTNAPQAGSVGSWTQWLTIGLEKNSIYADPCATLVGNTVKFCATSASKSINFAPLATDIGLTSSTNVSLSESQITSDVAAVFAAQANVDGAFDVFASTQATLATVTPAYNAANTAFLATQAANKNALTALANANSALTIAKRNANTTLSNLSVASTALSKANANVASMFAQYNALVINKASAAKIANALTVYNNAKSSASSAQAAYNNAYAANTAANVTVIADQNTVASAATAQQITANNLATAVSNLAAPLKAYNSALTNLAAAENTLSATESSLTLANTKLNQDENKL